MKYKVSVYTSNGDSEGFVNSFFIDTNDPVSHIKKQASKDYQMKLDKHFTVNRENDKITLFLDLVDVVGEYEPCLAYYVRKVENPDELRRRFIEKMNNLNLSDPEELDVFARMVGKTFEND